MALGRQARLGRAGPNPANLGALSAKKYVFRLVDLAGEKRRAALVGVQTLHQAVVGSAYCVVIGALGQTQHFQRLAS